MLKAFERALSTCKPVGSRVGTARPEEARNRAPVWVGLSLGLLILAFLMDGPIARTFTLQTSTFWRHLAVYLSKAGEGWVIALTGSIVCVFLFLVHRFHASRVAFLVPFTGLITGAAATIIRSLLGRTRPDAHELQGFYGVWHDSHWIIGKYEFGAFPSGHVATVIGLATAAWLIDRRWGMPAACYAVLVSWSRIALGCHHFSDTVAAAILGIYGAHLVLAQLGPGICHYSQRLQDAWLDRKRPFGPSNQSHA